MPRCTIKKIMKCVNTTDYSFVIVLFYRVGSVSSSSSGQTDSAAEERIAQILSEAQAAMQRKQEDVDKVNSKLK